uniref:Uncharacterized protein n=1 Tax=Tanacetum cinerariifolium TaxID=118510 RepID=A0A6L2KWU9_TANCI|nr:hypothetical protein [Tanacetum cinerariifolium]
MHADLKYIESLEKEIDELKSENDEFSDIYDVILQESAVLTKSGQVPVNAAKQSSHRAAASVSTARRVNTVASRPNVNDALLITYSYFKTYSPARRPFNQKSAAKTNNFNEKVTTAKVNNVTTVGPKAIVSAVEGNRNNVVKPSACEIWRPKGNLIDHISKDSGSYTLKRFNYGNPQYALQDQGIFNSRCSRHMTGNKSYLTNYQKIDGGFVAFRGNAKGGPKSSDDEVVDDAGKKSTEVPRKENGVPDPTKEGEAANTNRLNTVSSPVNAVSFSFTSVDPGRERAQRNEFESMFRQEKDAKGNRMFPPVSATGFTYVNLDGSILINAATLPNADLPINPLMPDLKDTTDLQDTRIFSGAYDDEVKGAEPDFNNLELTIISSPIPITWIHKDHSQY